MSILKVSCRLFFLIVVASFITSCTGEVEEDESDVYFELTAENNFALLATSRLAYTPPVDSTYMNEDEEYEEEEYEEEEGGYLRGCFEVGYPLDVRLADGSIETSNSDIDLVALYESWIEATLDSMDYPRLVYPIEITVPPAPVTTIDTDDELLLVISDCLVEED